MLSQFIKGEASLNLALFDFDGTLTSADTYTAFILFSTPKIRLVTGFLLLLPLIIGYRFGIYPASKLRPKLSKIAFCHRHPSEVKQQAKLFVKQILPALLLPEPLKQLEQHLASGDHVCLVSASVNPYLSVWCKLLGVELICSELEIINNKYTGRYLAGDCSGDNKVAQIHNRLDLNDYSTITAYGNSCEDLSMLALADIQYFNGQRIL